MVSKINMQDETDEALVVYMGFKDDEPIIAEEAVAELFRRHSKKMNAWCAKCFLLCLQNHEDLVMLTFQKALDAAKTFKPLAKSLSNTDKTVHVKAWLYSILRNLCIDAYRSEAAEREERSGVEIETVADVIVIDPVDSEEAEPVTPRRVDLVHEFITSLSARDQAILYNTMQYYVPSTGQTNMPKAILQDLCSELGMTKVSLKTQRFRLLERLKEYIVKHE